MRKAMASMAPGRNQKFEAAVRGQLLVSHDYISGEMTALDVGIGVELRVQEELRLRDERRVPDEKVEIFGRALRAPRLRASQIRASQPPAVLSEPEVGLSAHPTSEGSKLVSTIIENFVVPSYRAARDAETFLKFWLDNHEDFQHLARAHRLLEKESASGVASQVQETMARSVYEIAGERGETIYRSARADLAVAARLVQDFEAFSAEDEQEAYVRDSELIRSHNVSRRIAISILTCLTTVEVLREVANVTDDEITVMLEVGSAMAALVVHFAGEGARLRDLPLHVEFDVVQSAWPGPCGGMFKYLAKRDPSLLFEYIGRETNLGLQARAIEAVAQVVDHDTARSFLLPKLSGHLAIQEAVIYALRAHSNDDTLAALRKLASDPGTSDIIADLVAEELEAN
jgi:hypothetical protein